MQKAKKRRLLWLILGIFSAVSAAGGTALLAYLSLSGEYAWAVLVALITAHGYYGIPFYFGAMARASADAAILAAVADEKLSVEEISAATGYTSEAVRSRLSRSLAKGYITGYTMNESGLEKNN